LKGCELKRFGERGEMWRGRHRREKWVGHREGECNTDKREDNPFACPTLLLFSISALNLLN
jgi:hypothetical protein